MFDIERDHAVLIELCVRLLTPGGLVVFSTNSQRFKLDESLAARFDIQGHLG